MVSKIESLAKEFAQKGFPEVAASLNANALNARELGVPEQFTDVAPVSVSTSVETPGIIKPFSKEALEFLKKKDLLHYPLNGQSLKAQKLAGRPFWYIVDAGEKFLTLPSMFSQVAINPSPDKFFLPRSNNLTLLQQQEMIDEYSYKLQKEFGSKEIKAVMGDAPDYTSLAFLHLDATKGKERLFGVKYGYEYARTKTPTGGSGVAGVGHFHAVLGLFVSDWFAGHGNVDVLAAPLVVPV